MYLKRQSGPRCVTLSDGTTLTRADLPDPKTRRWVASRKNIVVQAVRAGLIDEDQACEMYELSLEELASWIDAVSEHGEKALKTTHLQDFRQKLG
jgi:hypothetical protein